jgi:hypothetical protein
VAIAVSVLLVDVVTRGNAWRQNPTFLLVTNGSLFGAAWVQAVSEAARSDGRGSAVLVPNDPVTASVFVMGEAQTYFPSLPAQVVLSKPGQAAAATAPAVRVDTVVDLPPDAPLPGWDPRWDALRWVARIGR